MTASEDNVKLGSSPSSLPLSKAALVPVLVSEVGRDSMNREPLADEGDGENKSIGGRTSYERGTNTI